MADYKCFDCRKTFPTEKLILARLKLEHQYKDHYKQLKCVVNYDEYKGVCDSHFLTFRGLRKHITTCIAARSKIDSSDALKNSHIDSLSDLFGDSLTVNDQVKEFIVL